MTTSPSTTMIVSQQTDSDDDYDEFLSLLRLNAIFDESMTLERDRERSHAQP